MILNTIALPRSIARQVQTRPSQRYFNRASEQHFSARHGEDETVIDLYDEIGFFGVSALDFRRRLNEVKTPRILLRVNSPGGDVFDGIAIYTLLRDHAATVTTYIDGIAASAASYIALAGDRVVIAKSAYMMIHEAMGIVFGYAEDMRRQADILDKLSDTIAEIYEDRAGGTRSQWRAAMGEETWYTAAEAVAAGLASEVSGEGEGGDAQARYRDSITAHLVTAMRDRLHEVPASVNTGGARHVAAAVTTTPATDAAAADFDIELERARLAVATAELGGN